MLAVFGLNVHDDPKLKEGGRGDEFTQCGQAGEGQGVPGGQQAGR